ncbi:MAG: DNA polymerase domain-containing protein [Thermoplasmata archaeon]|nr:DNA polymerase domain-containing protein [Thermoplasmata archaeon]
METAEIRILSTSYTTDGDEPVIEIYGKARDGRSATVLVRGFRPYLYGVEVPADLEKQLSEDGEVTNLEHKGLLYRGRTVDALRIEIKSPWKVSDFRSRLRTRGVESLAADIPFNHRYTYDTDMGACIRVSGEPVDKEYLTDITLEMSSFENIDPFDPGLRILSFDIENSVEHDFLYCICAVVWEKGAIRECEPISGTEKEIIEGFSDLIRREDPDVITGYNIDNYDIRKIEERAKANRMKDALPWGRDGGQPKLRSERFWRVKGRIICDAWWAARRELRPKQETLNAVSKELLGETKLDVDPRHMDAEWRDNRAKVLKYCTKDAELALRILLEVDTLRKGMDLAAVSKLSIEDVLTSGSSQLADSLLIRAADRANVAVPQMGKRVRDDDQIEGGYVHDIQPGLYHWVCVLDFKSMYPSTIIAKNICFTTLSPDGAIVAPSGTRFLSKDERVGLLPMILQGLMDQRDSIKRQMKQAKDEHERRYLDGLQAAVKVLMNTFYGVFASSFYRFTDKSIGAAITSFARANVKGIIGELQGEGHNVVYSDTDSVFVQSPEHSLEGSAEFGERMADKYSRDGGTLEFEKILEPLFTHGKKKRYVGRVVWPVRQEELLVRGYESRRTDSFDLQDRLQTEMFSCILDERNDDALALAKKTIQDTLAGRVDVSDLVISKSCKGLDAYENPERMANVQAAKKLIDLGYDFIPGMKVSWIVTDAKSAPMKVEPYISGAEFKAKPDYKYYAERLSKMAGMVTDVFGWGEKDLMMGSQQATLLDGGMFSSRDEPAKPKRDPPAAPKEKPKVRRLDDFFRSQPSIVTMLPRRYFLISPAFAASFGTPRPSSYMSARQSSAFTWPCFPASAYHLAASTSDSSTPSPPSYIPPNMYCASGRPRPAEMPIQ